MSTNSSLTPDEALIQKLRDNVFMRRRAEDEIFSRYSYFIKEGMVKYSLTEEDCFDAYSDTIVQGIKNINSEVFESRSSLKTYLHRIFNNKCVDLIRKKTTNKSSVHHTSAISDMLSQVADSAKSVVQRLIENTDRAHLIKKLDETGDNCKKLLSMFAEGYTDKEITALFNYKSADVVKTSRLRCLEKLRHLYNIKEE